MTRPEKTRGRIRIIAGKWRGTKIDVVAGNSLRPTPDRVRETVFNWLAPTLPGSCCLDLFAGSGALGFEALSRGASQCTFIESDRCAAEALTALAARLDAHAAKLIDSDALRWLDRTQPTNFDIIFLDPPFSLDLAKPVLTKLANGWLTPQTKVYLELPNHASLPGRPWRVLREQQTRQTRYALLQYQPNVTDDPAASGSGAKTGTPP